MFDGTDDYVTLTPFALGGQDFTIETYVYISSYADADRIFDFGIPVSVTNNYVINYKLRTFPNIEFQVKQDIAGSGTADVDYGFNDVNFFNASTTYVNSFLHLVSVYSYNSKAVTLYVNNVGNSYTSFDKYINRYTRDANILGARMSGTPASTSNLSLIHI